ncbi:MAG TPA: cytochrome c [Candidatus Acidoferrales bacterium]|nr:cytochrome c [Candidatus Acidoferrales bacterium]
MKRPYISALLFCLLAAAAGCGKQPSAPPSPADRAYDVEADWNDPQRVIPLGYRAAQGKRIFYTQCVWCHADATPAGPSNRSNVTPTPPLMNDGATLNKETNATLRNAIALGGSALGKSAMMPPYGRTLSEEEIAELIEYIRAIAQPPYQAPAIPPSGSAAK